MIRVLHLDHTDVAGGAEIALDRLVREAPNWYPIISIPHSLDSTEPRAFLGSAIPIHRVGKPQQSGASSAGRLGSLKFAISIVRQSMQLRRSAAFQTADVIHSNSSRSGLYGALALVGTSKPFVVHLRDMVTEESLGRIGVYLFRKIVLRRADGVIGNSEATLQTSIPFLRSNAQTTVIASPSGIQTRPTASNYSGSMERIGIVARLDPWKGQDLVLRAFARVFAGTEVRLVIAGAPAFGHSDYEEALLSLVSKLKISDQVDFLGHVNDVPHLISTLDICVQASLRPEPLGQNVLQYLAGGRPTIIADQGGPIEWIKDGVNGLHFVSGNEQSLADALERLATDRHLRIKTAQNALTYRRVPTDREIADTHGYFFRLTADNSFQAAQQK